MLETIVVGPLQTNCYILGCDETREATVIDPGDDGPIILERLEIRGLTCKRILNTHGHGDHIGANAAIKSATAASLAFHSADRFLVERAVSMALSFGFSIEASPDPDEDLEDKKIISFGKEKLLVLHTPGHSPGGVSFVWGKNVFCGDLLFAGGIGRHDLPGGSFREILESIVKKLYPLGEDATVYPGHGPSTTIGYERKTNPFLTDIPHSTF